MILSFGDRFTREFWETGRSRRIPGNLNRVALRKLAQIHIAKSLDDVRTPPRNHLEALRGDRQGQHSIRVNDQWRICFTWREGNDYEVEIVDFH
jgi:proteic killer suppression protein